MNATGEIIERIKKLLRLARSSNPHEAQLAMQRALALAEEHRVAIEGLNPDECAKEKKVTHQETEISARLSYDKRYAWAICRNFFNVDTVQIACIRMVDGWPRAGVKMAIVGTAADIEIARYVSGFLVQHFAFCWRTFRGRFRNRQAFVHGMFCGIYDKLEEKRPKKPIGTELVVRERDTYIALHVGKTKQKPLGTPDHDAHGAEMAGYLHGQKTEIRTALKPAEAQLAIA